MSSPSPGNTVFTSVAAWRDAEAQSEVFRLSAEKQKIPLRFIDYGAKWQGFYQHKIIHLRHALQGWQKKGFEYVLFSDARDAVFIGSAEEITARFVAMNHNAVLFAADKPQTVFPFQKPWFRDAMKNRNGIVNAGTYIGSIDAVLDLFEECDLLRENARQINEPAVTAVQLALLEGRASYYEDDQFYFQILQMQDYPGIRTDTKKQLFAVFDYEFPNFREQNVLPVSDERSVGTALVLHSPWLSKKKSEDGVSLWKQWAECEGIIESGK